MAGKQGHRGFGHVRKLPSRKFQASYTGPDGRRHLASDTFMTWLDAEGWLAAESRLIADGHWRAPEIRRRAFLAARVTVADYAETWLKQRTLKPRTVALYQDLLQRCVVPTLGDQHVSQLAPATVREWYSTMDGAKPRQRPHAYALLRSICNTAVDDELLPANPCRIRGAGQATRTSTTEPATLPELDIIVDKMPERLRLMVLLAAWCALRYGELAELRRGDLDLANNVVHVHRAVVWVNGKPIVGDPEERGRQARCHDPASCHAD